MFFNKKSFLIKYENEFKHPLLVQTNNAETEFSRSNRIFFENLPCIYPLLDKTTGEVKLKQLNEEALQVGGDKLNVKEIYGFLKSYLSKAIKKNFKPAFTVGFNKLLKRSKINENQFIEYSKGWKVKQKYWQLYGNCGGGRKERL